MTVPNGVDYGAPDSKPSDILFMIAAPVDGDLHLEIFSRLMVMLMEPEFCTTLRNAETADEFLDIIDKKEAEKYPEEAAKPEVKAEGYRILAVTACPTGIAHTYMAADALEKAGEKLGYPLKAETNGSGGAKNVLTKKEIAECDGIILAADKNAEIARFDGKPVVKTSVSNGINKPEELIKKIVDGKASVYHADESEKLSVNDDEKESGRHKLYKHLMNGVSHMLPFVVGGGILIALGFLFDTLAGNADVVGTFGFTSPVATVVFWIGKAAFALMLPILSAYIASSIAYRPGLLPGMISGVFASSGYTFSSLIENQGLVGDDKAVSGFLGALLAGFLAGVIVNLLKKAFSWLPKSMDGKEVIIRTLNIGGDKAIDYLKIEKEDNPFLGRRAVRYCLDNPKIFKTQLRAILRAAVFGDIKVMLPLVTTLDEVRKAKALIEECKNKLKDDGLRFAYIPVGAMIETPSAAIISDLLAKEVAFFSIGTNDLTGYTMAVDRGNAAVSELYDPTQPAVLRLIEMTIKNAKKAGIPVGMCGEAAADTRLIQKLCEWGLDEFSVTPSSILHTRKTICECECE